MYNNLSINSIFNINFDNGGSGYVYSNTTYGASQNELMMGNPYNGPMVVKNNLCYAVGGVIAYKVVNSIMPTSDYNLIYVSDAGVPFQFNNTNYSSLATWQTATSQDAHSTTGNPLLVTPGGSTAASYKFTGASPAKDTGATIVGFNTDYFGTTRPQGSAWDIGFFELLPSKGFVTLILN
jgi:hypothetical protein